MDLALGTLLLLGIFFFYFGWRVWVAVKHLDPMPWQFPVLLFFLAAPPISWLGSAAAGRFFPQADGQSVRSVSLILCVILAAGASFSINRVYDRWRQQEQEKRDRERRRRDPDMAP